MALINSSSGRIGEPLQNYCFWLVDIAPIDFLSLPIFLPTLGFQSITAPEISLNMKEIREGNWYFGRKVVMNATVNRLTLTRGVRFYDSDFERWMTSGLTGNPAGFKLKGVNLLRVGGPTPRRTMMLIHFFSRVTTDDMFGFFANIGLAAAAAGAGGDFLGATGLLTQQLIGKLGMSLGPFDQVARLPAKAYILHGCLPSRYKVASGFDANSPEVSVAELDLEYEMIEEISLAG